jgi:hypothetical protein
MIGSIFFLSKLGKYGTISKSIEDRRKIINKSLSYFLISFLKTAFYKKKAVLSL